MSAPSATLETPAIPAFLTKLRLLVDDEETNDLIYWDPGGSSFHITDGNRLAKEILPLIFKHNNLSSFVRQLNMYGFRKVNRFESVPVGFKSDNEGMEFKHPYFVRHKPHLMSKIQRKSPNVPYSGLLGGRHFNGFGSGVSFAQSTVQANPDHDYHPSASVSDFMRMSAIIRTMRIAQESMSQQLALLQSENELLFRELHDLRDRHERQAQLIQTDTRGQGFSFGVKRKALPLALLDRMPSHTGLRLNLPQGYRLDDDSFQQMKTELSEVPYKLARRDPSFSGGPSGGTSAEPNNQLVAVTNSNSIRLLPSNTWDDSNNVRNMQALVLKSDSGPRILSTEHVLMPSQSTAGGDLDIVSAEPQQTTLEQSAPEPVTNESDLTLASLTTETHQATKPGDVLDCQALDLATSSSAVGRDFDTGQQQLVDLNLSRCTTPVSLIQPDSVDICELLGAARNETESEISIDDLFLSSGTLDDFKVNQDRFGKASSLNTPRVCGDSTDDSNTISLFKTEPQVSHPASSADVQSTLQTVTESSADLRPQVQSTPSKSSSLQSLGLQDLGRENLFGLPWDEQEDAESLRSTDYVEPTADAANHFNVGLLPVRPGQQHSNAIVAKHEDTGVDESLVLDDETLPTETPALPVATIIPTSVVRVLQPTTAVLPPHYTPVTTLFTSQRGSPPIVLGRSPKILLPTSSTTSTMRPSLARTLTTLTPTAATTVQLATPLVQVHPTQLVRPVTYSLRPRAVSRRKERPTFRPIAPAPRSCPPPTSASSRTKKT